MRDTDFLGYLKESIRLCECCSPETAYDEGYLSALRDALEDLTELRAIERLPQ